MRFILLIPVLTCFCLIGSSQEDSACIPTTSSAALSPRIANYTFDINFDHTDHKVSGEENIVWINSSPDTIRQIRMYMYLNAFKDVHSSYITGSGMNVMGQNLSGRSKEDWGYVKVNEVFQEGQQLSQLMYIQPDDDNTKDESVLRIDLITPLIPRDTLRLRLDFVSKLPRTIARSGYGNHDFNHFVHWYPKMGVYERDEAGEWGWNCHQFLRQMEFYGDHGNYEVNIESADHFTIGGSGCRSTYKEPITGSPDRALTKFVAEDVIDFGWVASPLLKEYNDQWEHVEIRLLSPEVHAGLVPRLLKAAKHSLAYFAEHVGEYPYNTLTILDPPVHGLRSGFMEYPTYITGGSFYSFPKGARSMESLIVHEFSHQYFMQILANNEKEAPWLDEGFVTFYEDCVMEDGYGEASLIDLLGYRVKNSALTRNEYTSLSNPRTSAITTTGWKVRGDYKGIIYSKTATVLQTLRRYLGEEHFDEMMRAYFEKNKFTHPRKSDFTEAVKEEFNRHPNVLSPVIDQFLTDALDETKVCDYSVVRIGSGFISDSENRHNFAVLERKGDFIVPVEVMLHWSDGSTSTEIWDGAESIYTIVHRRPETIIGVEIDPERKLFLDIDFNNNSYTSKPEKGGIWKYATRSIYWVQNAIQSTSFLM